MSLDSLAEEIARMKDEVASLAADREKSQKEMATLKEETEAAQMRVTELQDHLQAMEDQRNEELAGRTDFELDGEGDGPYGMMGQDDEVVDPGVTAGAGDVHANASNANANLMGNLTGATQGGGPPTGPPPGLPSLPFLTPSPQNQGIRRKEQDLQTFSSLDLFLSNGTPFGTTSRRSWPLTAGTIMSPSSNSRRR